MSDRDTVADVLGMWRQEAERGRRVEPDELIESHPEVARDLRRHFEAQDVLDRFFAEADARPAEAPAVLGDYRIGREIGRGGMGVVYEAEQISMERRVALKVLFPTIGTTVTTRKRFENEARITGRLHHTNIVMVHAMGRQDGYLYFAMELVEGSPLDDVIAHLRETEHGDLGRASIEGHLASLRGPHAYVRIAQMFAGVADALQVAHASGVIHRDVKPSNLILNEQGLLKLTDFGLARLVGDRLGVTRTGDVVGTPLYMSPEQIKGQSSEIDPRSDVYSLGATLYEFLALKRAHDAEDVVTLCSQILTRSPASVRHHRHDIPKDLATIVHKAMEKSRADRYATAGKLASDLYAVAEGRQIAARPVGPFRRGWRVAKRHRVRTSLGLGAVLLSVLVLVLGVSLSREGELRREQDYKALIWDASGAGIRLTSHDPTLGNPRVAARLPGSDRAFGALTDATVVRPDRPDAFLLRGLLPHRELNDRLGDLDMAYARGLDPHTFHLARAVVNREHRQHATAKADEEAAEQLDPQSPYASFLTGRLLLMKGKFAQAAVVLTRAVDLNSHTSVVHLLAHHDRARARGRIGDLAGAIEDYASLANAGWEDPGVRVRVAKLWRQLDQELRAQAIIDSDLAATHSVGDWLLMWSTSHRAGQPQWTASISKAAYAQHPTVPVVVAWRAVTVARQGERDLALELIDRAQRLAPKDVEVLLSNGETLTHLGELSRAEEIIRAVLNLEPDSAVAASFMQYICGVQGRPSESIDWGRRLAELAPFEALPRANLAQSLITAGRLDEALKEVARGLELDPAYGGLYLHRAQVYIARENYEGALSDLKRARELEPDNPNYRSLIASLHNRAGRHEDAREAYLEAARLAADIQTPRLAEYNARFPNDAAWFLLTCPTLVLRDPARATELAEFAVDACPEEANYWNTLGWARLRSGRANLTVVEAFERVMSLHPDGGDAGTWYGLSIAKARERDIEAAEKWMKRADAWTAALSVEVPPSLVEFQEEARAALELAPTK